MRTLPKPSCVRRSRRNRWRRIRRSQQRYRPEMVRIAARRETKIARLYRAILMLPDTYILQKWAEPESNRRHMDFQSIALPAELPALKHKARYFRRGLRHFKASR